MEDKVKQGKAITRMARQGKGIQDKERLEKGRRGTYKGNEVTIGEGEGRMEDKTKDKQNEGREYQGLQGKARRGKGRPTKGRPREGRQRQRQKQQYQQQQQQQQHQ